MSLARRGRGRGITGGRERGRADDRRSAGGRDDDLVNAASQKHRNSAAGVPRAAEASRHTLSSGPDLDARGRGGEGPWLPTALTPSTPFLSHPPLSNRPARTPAIPPSQPRRSSRRQIVRLSLPSSDTGGTGRLTAEASQSTALLREIPLAVIPSSDLEPNRTKVRSAW